MYIAKAEVLPLLSSLLPRFSSRMVYIALSRWSFVRQGGKLSLGINPVRALWGLAQDKG
ncbi:hypothetical protein SYN63AY4M2_11015 [Synechococcus sp. 63AY4M2]|nr:hypothetical protein SYN63AY4M2_11015 [Synechococcus sp. 63AY4M2]PIK89649.1 hypothetical protein SYN65AY6A5_01275 [Synechococcus sp. 65AY6A5]PIK93215.1 hypothetical protein SYN65AY6LI_08490 [Synechococcus sp. 65AY6Li]PIK96528.1 hypothetical protein SYN60AY4M2_11625 [Synechococcus sp. 60AY4M2]PIK99130.1 hypothetical protein SYN63AY4M1_09055 [Synechococcus sp. 63AY4M1]PIL02430.1 hypothetical protein SYN65AY640_05040 [Synechococcus sp. 65AY640]